MSQFQRISCNLYVLNMDNVRINFPHLCGRWRLKKSRIEATTWSIHTWYTFNPRSYCVNPKPSLLRFSMHISLALQPFKLFFLWKDQLFHIREVQMSQPISLGPHSTVITCFWEFSPWQVIGTSHLWNITENCFPPGILVDGNVCITKYVCVLITLC